MASQQRDYYEVLGVSRTSTPEEMKRAYRNLARKFHPDVNRAADAADKFKEIQEAYDVLSDETKRQQYDQFGHAGLNGNRGYGAAPDVNFSDIFDIFFGQGGGGQQRGGPPQAARGDDLREDLELTLEEVAVGVEKTIQFTRMETCSDCQGSGAKPGTSADNCPVCHGNGQIRYSQNTLLGTFTQMQTCGKCRGTGKIITNPCLTCHGSGRSRQNRERSIKIPAGADTGMRMRLIGEGDAGERGGPSGDLYVVLFVHDHEIFERRGNDLFCEVPISFVRAALGDTIQIPIINGIDELKINEGTQPNQVYTLRGKGIPELNGRGKGDLHVICKIEVPKHLNSEQKDLLRKLGETMNELTTTENGESKGLFGRLFGN